MKRTLGVLAALLIMLAAVPAAVKAAEVTEYPLWVGNVHVTSEVSSGTGWKFEASASGGTLTLEDANITDAAFTVDSQFTANIGVSTGADFDLVVELKGNNTLSGADYGIYFFSLSSLKILGPGSLEVKDENKAVYSYSSDFTEIKGAEINASVYGTGIFTKGLIITDSVITSKGVTCGIDCIDLTISNSYVSADGEDHTGIYCGKLTVSGDSYLKAYCERFGAVFCEAVDIDLSESGGFEIWEPSGGKLLYDEEYGKYRAYDGDNVADTLIIGKAYPLWIGSEQVTTENMRDLTAIEGVDAAEGGSASYDPETSTLTLDNVKVTKTHNIDGGSIRYALFVDRAELNIILKGDNEISCPEEPKYAIFGRHALITFDVDPDGDGYGALTAAGELEGLYAFEGSVTVNGGELIFSGGTVGIECDQGTEDQDHYYNVMTVNGGSVKASGGYYQGVRVRKLVVSGGRVESETKNAELFYQGYPVSALSYETEIVLGENMHITLPENAAFRNDGEEDEPLWNITDGKEYVMKCVIEKAATVEFLDYDGTKLQSGYVAFGSVPTYNGEKEPAKEADAQYTYTFFGWKDEQGNKYAVKEDLPKVDGDTTYTAHYSETRNEYTVKFLDEDGTELQSGKVAYGETPEYKGEEPSKKETEKYAYTFSGWTPAITKVTGDAAYTAVFIAAEKDPVYTVKDGADGSWTKGSGKSFSITVKRSFDDEECFSHFTGVSVDGKALDKSAYKAEKGSTVVTIGADALDSLSEEDHTVTVEFDDGEAETSITVKAAEKEEEKTPDTDDSEHIVVLAVISAVSLVSLGAVLTLRKRSLI